jgi:hypothetical protein
MLLWLAACHPEPAESGDPVDSDVIEHVGTNDTDTDVVPDDACSDLYAQDAFPRFEVLITADDWAALEADYAAGQKNYHPIAFIYGDEVRGDAQIRLKGNPGFSWLGDKLQFVISFDEIDPEARFHGVRKLSLDASWYEPTLLRDRLAWDVMGDVDGLPSTCVNDATLYINGEYYGVYANIEYLDHEWLERNYGDDDATGVLWKYGTEPKTNRETADPAATQAFFAATDLATLRTLGDLGEWELAWAAEAVLGDDDGFWCCEHNFYLYEHPSRGLLFVPWDFDDTFDVVPYDEDPIAGYSNRLFQQPAFLAVIADPTERARYVDAVATVAEALDPDAALAALDAGEAQLDDAIATDPHRTWGWDEHVQAMARFRAWVRARRAFLDSWVACERGSTADADADGFPVCADPDDADPAVHPGAAEDCDGVDDDANGVIDDAATCDDCVRHDFEAEHFLFCRAPRSWRAAESACEAHGGALAAPASTPAQYVTYFDTWPVFEPWWLGGTDIASDGTWLSPDGSPVGAVPWAYNEPDGGARENCAAWNANFGWGWMSADCGALHPSICALP